MNLKEVQTQFDGPLDLLTQAQHTASRDMPWSFLFCFFPSVGQSHSLVLAPTQAYVLPFQILFPFQPNVYFLNAALSDVCVCINIIFRLN